jgi:hypothetical protein
LTRAVGLFLFLGLASVWSPSRSDAQSSSGAADAATVTTTSAVVEAPATTPEQDAEARQLFEEGRQAWERQDAAEAASRWERAYHLSGRAELLFNVGNARLALHQLDAAESAYRRFLEQANPDAVRRREVEGRIDEIRVQRSSVEATSTPPGEDVGTKFLGTWISGGTTIVLAGAGAALLAGGVTDGGNALLGLAALGAVTTVVVLFVEGDFGQTPNSTATSGRPPALLRF